MAENQEAGSTSQTKMTLVDEFKDLLAKEVWSRNDIALLTIPKLNEIDELLKRAANEKKEEAIREAALEHLAGHRDSNISKYVLGIFGFTGNRPEDTPYLKAIMDQIRTLGKWQILVHLGERMLEFGNSRFALRAIVDGMDHGSYPKAKIKPYYEKLAKLDRKNPEIAEKYGRSLIDDGEKENGLSFIKQAADSYARAKNYDKLHSCWKYLVDNDPEDLAFFEKIERVLVNQREQQRASELLMQLVDYHSGLINVAGDDSTEAENLRSTKISLLKRVLDYNPQYQKARNDIINTYKTRYKDHSLLQEVLQHSGLTHSKTNINLAIEDFERNIVFDKGNYVAHKSWGVGQIEDLNQQEIIINFKEKPGHKMSIQMALKSLRPLEKDHVWVRYFEDPEGTKTLFEEEPVEFMILLLKSFRHTMVLADIKNEIIGRFLPQKDWSKWWTRVKLQLKKHPNIGFSPRKKDEIFYREEKITLSDELIDKFSANSDLNKKLNTAMESLEAPDEAQEAIDTFVNHYNQEESHKEAFRRITAFVFLHVLGKKLGDEELHQKMTWEDLKQIIQSAKQDDLVRYSSEIKNTDIKKEYLGIIKRYREDYPEIYARILYEVPIKIHKFVFSELVKEEKFETLNEFVTQVSRKLKDFPEVFLWMAKNILNDVWNYDWLKVNREDLTLRVFRLLSPLNKIEKTGTKLKKSAVDLIFGNDAAVISGTVKEATDSTVRKMYALFREVPYIEDSQKSRLASLIQALKPDMQWQSGGEESGSGRPNMLRSIPGPEIILVTQGALDRKKKEYEHIVNVEMVENSKDIGEAQEKGDLRENAEYAAAMDRQRLLQATMTQMDADFKKVAIIDPEDVETDSVCIGTRLLLRNLVNDNEQYFTILGPWDADSEKNIISYRSPLAEALIGREVNDIASYEGADARFQILKIEKAV